MAVATGGAVSFKNTNEMICTHCLLLMAQLSFGMKKNATKLTRFSLSRFALINLAYNLVTLIDILYGWTKM